MNKFLLIISFFCFINAYGQVAVKYETSDKLKDTKFTSLTSSAVSHDGKNIIIIKSMPKLLGKSKQRLQMLNENMQIIADKEVDEIIYHSIISMKEKSYFLYSDKEGGLFMKEIDESNMKMVGKQIKVLQMDRTKGMGLGKKYFNIPKHMVSQDSTKLAFLLIDDVKRKETQSFATAVYDQNISKIWGKRFDVGMRDKDYKLSDTRVGNDGALYLTGLELSEKKLLSKEFNNVQIKRIKGDKTSKYTVNLDDEKRYVGEVELMDSNQSDSGIDILAFMYESKTGLSDVLVAQLDEDLNITHKKMNEVSFQDFIVDDNDKAKDKAKNRKGNASEQRALKIRHLSKLSDNRQLVVAEQYYVVVHHSYNPQTGASSTTYTYHYEDVVAFLFSEQGEMLWAKKIAKRQVGGDPSPYGISVYQGKNNAYILFNDDEKNADPNRKKLYGYGKEYKKGIFKVVQIDINTGKTTEDVVFNLKEEGMYVQPSNYYQMGDGSLILMGFKKKDRTILKMKFPEE